METNLFGDIAVHESNEIAPKAKPTARKKASTVAPVVEDLIGMPPQEFDPLRYIRDIREVRASLDSYEFTPDEQRYSKEILMKLPEFKWMADCTFNLIVPRSEDKEDQRIQLADLKSDFHNACMRLTDGIPADLDQTILDNFISKTYPEGFDEKVLALDTETTGLDLRLMYDEEGNLAPNTLIVGVSLAVNSYEGCYLPVRHTGTDGRLNWDWEVLASFIEELHQEFLIVYHNASYDREVLALNGVKGFREYPYFFDTLVLSFNQDMDRIGHGLKVLAKEYLDRPMVQIKDLFDGVDVLNFQVLPSVNAYVYACSDAMNTYGLLEYFLKYFPKNDHVLINRKVPTEKDGTEDVPVAEAVLIDHKTVDALRSICRVGLPMNYTYFYYAALDTLCRLRTLEAQIKETVAKMDSEVLLANSLVDFELGSNPQVSKLLFNVLKLQPLEGVEPNAKGIYTVDEKTLDALQEKYPTVPLLGGVVLFRKLVNASGRFIKCVVNSYVDTLQPYTKVKLSFLQTKADTGRLSSSSNRGCDKVVAIEAKTKKRTMSYRFDKGGGDAGINSQAIPSKPPLMVAKARRIKKIGVESGFDLADKVSLYPKEVYETFIIKVASLRNNSKQGD
jgi:hypothetical protein